MVHIWFDFKFIPMISFANIIDADPNLDVLANNGGSVWTHAIAVDSPAVDKELYVKREGTTYYYSTSGEANEWYTEPDLSKEGDPPADAEDLTATDATGYTRTDSPDLGAYEYRHKFVHK